jgi:hypothetical protein
MTSYYKAADGNTLTVDNVVYTGAHDNGFYGTYSPWFPSKKRPIARVFHAFNVKPSSKSWYDVVSVNTKVA